MSYSYKSVGPNGKTNGTNFLTFMSIKLGEDYNLWNKHPEFKSSLQEAHEIIFSKTGTYNGGLKLRTDFLMQNEKQPKETKLKRQCYNDVLYDALEAGIINTSKFKELVV